MVKSRTIGRTKFIFFHDCNDCKYNHECKEEKSFSTDCQKFEYREDL